MADPDVLLIGAGAAGLTAARALDRRGLRCVLLDKGRVVGGRMATRRMGGGRFDHGAQHFSARSDEFRAEVDGWRAAGVAKVWLRTPSRTEPDRGVEPRHAGVGGMRRIPERLAGGLDVRTGNEVERLELANRRVGARGVTARAVVITPPLPQALALLSASGIEPDAPLAGSLGRVRYDACLAVLALLDGPAGLDYGHVAPGAGPVAWIADNQHKGVSPIPAVTIHSTPAFAADHMEEPPERWVALLAAAARPHLSGRITEAAGHRWRYSMPRHTLDTGCAPFAAGGVPVVLAGEVFAGARVEGAFTSGRAAADWLTERLL